ncbi:hypothetical protein ASD79_05600 [Caulobacter sp. Root655]|uniref:LysR family transcriptional regulator n=1 Tax=Caulobacter sp. Root655 TaxID=1736578 RepID=UPI0006FBDED1|nr:LysR family transcriptional regulator [Caulobacter sp. Root655]KRA61591.1 hypothetical protein ASD79_05600 [Caulobacter sp. Root655]
MPDFNFEQTDWDDLRVALAIARAGSLSGAARTIGVSHPTMFRRLRSLEARLGVRLFERTSAGLAPSAAGEALVQAAEAIEARLTQLGRTLEGREGRPSGTVRLATTDTLMAGPLPPMLAAFRGAYPEIVVEAGVSNAMADLSRREADVAIRPALDPPPTLTGRRVCALAFAVYGAPGDTGQGEGDWVAPDDSLSALKLSRWMAERGLSARATFRGNSLVSLREAARAGLGRAVLPCYLGDLDPGLRRLGDPIAELATELWVLTHPDLTTAGRIRAFLDEIYRRLAERRDLFEGT